MTYALVREGAAAVNKTDNAVPARSARSERFTILVKRRPDVGAHSYVGAS
jgi:hypothetical protein